MSPALYQRAKSIFVCACERSGQARHEFLAQACGQDDELRQAVDRLLRNDADPIPLVSPAAFQDCLHAVAEKSRHGFPGTAGGNDIEDIPAAVGRYRIIRKLGEGGMGVVYEARDDFPARTVALKLIRPGLVARQVLRRFEREANVLGHLQHPGIAQIYEAGFATVYTNESTPRDWHMIQPPGAASDASSAAAGVSQAPYFAMEYVRGKTLTDFARSYRLDVRNRLELFASVCDAVQHAHEKGIIHRDLKPSNILVAENRPLDDEHARDGDRRRSSQADAIQPSASPKILDFGVARLTDADVQTMTLQTDVGQLIGTIPYMSPEQVSGNSGLIDARSDVYALGVVLFELLTGRQPYVIDKHSIPDAARVIRETEPSRLSSFDSVFRGDVDTIVRRALEKDASRRYQSAANLAEDIRRHLRDEPILARPPSKIYQLRKFARRHKGLVSGLALTFLVLTAGTIVSILLALRASEQRDLADRNAAESRAARDDLRRQLYQARLAAAVIAIRDGDGEEAQAALNDCPPALRNWEWEYLHRLTDRSWLTLHMNARVLGCRITDAADRLVAVESSGRIATWRLPTAEQLSVVETGQAACGHASISGDGRFALIVSAGRTAELWNVPLGMRVATFEKPAAIGGQFRSHGEAFSPDASRVFLGFPERGCVSSFDTETGREASSIACPSSLAALEVSADGHSLLWVSLKGAELVDSATGRSLWSGDVIARLAPDGSILARNLLRSSWELVAPNGLATRALTSIASMGGILALGPGANPVLHAGARDLRLWESDDRAQTKLISADHGERVAAFSSELSAVAVGFEDGTIKVWALPVEDAPMAAEADEALSACAISRDGSRTAGAGWRDVQLYDRQTGRELWRRFVLPGAASAAAFSPDGSRIAVTDETGCVTILDVSSGAVVLGPLKMRNRLTCVAWIGEPNLALGDEAGAILIVDAMTGTIVREWKACSDAVHHVALSDDDSMLVSSDSRGSIDLWDIATGQRRWNDQQPCAVNCMAFSPDRSRLAAGREDGQGVLWAVDTGYVLGNFACGSDPVRSVAFKADGTRLAAAGAGRDLFILDGSNGKAVVRLPIDSQVRQLSWRQDDLLAITLRKAAIAFETEPPASEIKVARVTESAAQRLLQQWPSDSVADIVAMLRADQFIDERTRSRAIELAGIRGTHPWRANSAAWNVVLECDREPAEYALALRRISAACEALPENYSLLNTLGIAQYRTGSFSAALATLRECDRLAVSARGMSSVADVAFLAMCLKKLGQMDAARVELARARQLASELGGDSESMRFMREAESLFQEGD